MKSTVPVGTADKIREQLKGLSHRVEVVSNLEFSKEGTAVGDFLRLKGLLSGASPRTLGKLWAIFTRPMSAGAIRFCS